MTEIISGWAWYYATNNVHSSPFLSESHWAYLMLACALDTTNRLYAYACFTQVRIIRYFFATNCKNVTYIYIYIMLFILMLIYMPVYDFDFTILSAKILILISIGLCCALCYMLGITILLIYTNTTGYSNPTLSPSLWSIINSLFSSLLYHETR